MIPVSQDERLPWRDEQDNITYYFRSMTGANEHRYVEITSELQRGNLESEVKILDDLTDFFLVGWAGENIPDFPADGKPSRFFKSADKDRLVGKALEINRMRSTEIKN